MVIPPHNIVVITRNELIETYMLYRGVHFLRCAGYIMEYKTSLLFNCYTTELLKTCLLYHRVHTCYSTEYKTDLPCYMLHHEILHQLLHMEYTMFI